MYLGTYNATVRGVSATIVAVQKLYVFCVCVCSLRYPACNASALLYCHVASAAVQHFSTLSHKQQDFHKKKETLVYIKRELWFFLQFLSETFLVVRTERDAIPKVHRSSCEVRVILWYFNETWIFWAVYSKNTQISCFMKIRSLEAELFHMGGRADRRTWRS